MMLLSNRLAKERVGPNKQAARRNSKLFDPMFLVLDLMHEPDHSTTEEVVTADRVTSLEFASNLAVVSGEE